MKYLQLGRTGNMLLYFFLGALLASFVLVLSFAGVFYLNYNGKIYPGVRVNNVDLSGMSEVEAKRQLETNFSLDQSQWSFTYNEKNWIQSGRQIGVKVDSTGLTNKAFSIGRNLNPYLGALEIWQGFNKGFNLPLKVIWPRETHEQLYSLFRANTDATPIDAQFKFDETIGPDHKGRVVAFVQSRDGQSVDEAGLEQEILLRARTKLVGSASLIEITVPVKKVLASVSTNTVNNLGIVEKIGLGESYFYDSIPGRIYNIELGTQKINGSLIAPGEIFSFDQAIGTVSALFGFKKAYAIVQGKTVLDDGGGVCQVSTTLYRAVLNAGLPVVERVGHSYRVSFYEQGGFQPGMDATVYPPSPDFRFKNDTGNWILVQATFDKTNSRLSFELFGKNDGRITEVSKPVITSSTPPPEAIYEDDPTLQAGTIKQTDTAHYGANVYFTRLVTRNGETLINEKVTTNYVPWPARYLKGTKPN